MVDRLGVSKQATSNWENDNIHPAIEMLLRLAEQFCVTTDYLLGREDCLRIDLRDLDPRVVWHISLRADDLRKT